MPIDPTRPHPDGTIGTRDDGRGVLRYERYLAHSPQRVWAALTEPEQLVGWLAEATLDGIEGGAIRLRWLNTDPNGNHAIMQGRITRLEEPRLLEWDSDIHGVLRWELRPAGSGTRLTLTITIEAAREQVELPAAGWHTHLEHLAESIDGQPVDWTRWDRDHLPRWRQHHVRYAGRA